MRLTLASIQPFLEQFELPEDPQDRLAVLCQLEHLIAGLRQQVEHELEAIRAQER